MVREYTYDSVSSEASKRGASESEDSDSDEPVFRRAYEVTEFSVAATASMPSEPFEERDDRTEQHP